MQVLQPPPRTSSTVKMTITFTKVQHAYLAREAGRLQISIADLVRRVLDAHRS